MSRIAARDCGAPTVFQLYLREIQDDGLLTAAEEKHLAEAIARGDREARTRMIQANLRLVVRIAQDYVGRGIVLDDLVGEGNLGLIRAAEEFDPQFGTRFSTYASYWIKQAIRHALVNTTATIRLPAHMVLLLSRWRRAERALYRESGREPAFDEIAVRLGLTEAQKTLVAKAQQARRLKLENVMAGDVGSWSPDDFADERPAPETRLESREARDRLSRRLDRLDARERSIIVWRYGLEGEASLTLKEIGQRLGITREWVRKIELRALRKMDDRMPEAPSHGPRRRGARSVPASQTASVSTRYRPAVAVHA